MNVCVCIVSNFYSLNTHRHTGNVTIAIVIQVTFLTDGIDVNFLNVSNVPISHKLLYHLLFWFLLRVFFFFLRFLQLHMDIYYLYKDL